MTKITVANFLCVIKCREWEDIGLFITPVPKILYYRLLFVGLATLGIYNEFRLVVHKVECPNISTTNCKLQRGNLCIIIRDVCTSIYRPLSYPYRSLVWVCNTCCNLSHLLPIIHVLCLFYAICFVKRNEQGSYYYKRFGSKAYIIAKVWL